jgi:hypothetical protein
MQEPVRSMTLQELRVELDQTCPAREAIDRDGVHALGQRPALARDAHRHQVVAGDVFSPTCPDDAA